MLPVTTEPMSLNRTPRVEGSAGAPDASAFDSSDERRFAAGGAPPPPELVGHRLQPGASAVKACFDDGRVLLVTRLSPVDLAGLASCPAPRVGEHVTLKLRGPHQEIGPLAATVTRVEEERDAQRRGRSARVEVKLTAPTRETGDAILGLLRALAWRGLVARPSSYERVTELVTDPTRIDAVLRGLCAERARARLFAAARNGEGRGETVSARLVRFDAQERLGLSLEIDRPPPSLPFDVEMVGYLSNFLFRVEAAEEREPFLAVAAPRSLVRTRSRRYRRVAAPAGATVRFQHPLWPELVVQRPLRDVSLAGLSFAGDGARDGLFPGLDLPLVQVDWPGRVRILFRGRVRHVSDDAPQRETYCGVELEPLATEDGERWREETARSFFPSTRAGAGWHREIWEVYERSGYFAIGGKRAEEFTHLRESFARVNRALAGGTPVGCQLIWPSERGVESSVTVWRAYSGTWVDCQLGKLPGRPPTASTGRQILRDTMLHAFEHVQRDPSFRWFLTWVRHDIRFSRHLICDLTDRFRDDTERVAVVPFHAMEGACNLPASAPPPGIEITLADDAEVRRTLGVLEGLRTRPYLEAHDLVPGRFGFQTIGSAWAASGLQRGRELIVARKGGRALAAAILESAEEGAHVFGLLDVVRVVVLEAGGEALRGALLDAARGWYHVLGKRKFIYFLESVGEEPAGQPIDTSHALAVGMTDLGPTEVIVLSSELMPDQIEHAWEVTAPRPPRTDSK